jgi:Zn-dependent peptidase ImmA (M78 family)
MSKVEAIAAAASLRHRLGLGTGFVDVFDVIHQQGIELYRSAFGHDSLEGAHLVRDGRAFIYVNTSGSITRQRMTAAHELGHHLLDKDVDDSVVYESSLDPGNDPNEWTVYMFARYFLMDPDGVRRLTGDIDDSEQRVAAVASRFVTSIDVACIHLEDLNVISAAVKGRLLEEVRSGALRPKAFLQRFGYRLEPTPTGEARELDPGFVGRVIDAYAREWISFRAFADVLQMNDEVARALIAEHHLPVPNAE